MPFTISICAICHGAIAGPVEVCYACASATERLRAGDNPDAPVVLTSRDGAAIRRFAQLRLAAGDPLAWALREKLERSRIVPADAIDADIATLGSRIVFAVGDGWPEARVLVLPAEHAAAGWTLPVTTPRGMSLLGRAANSVMTVAGPGGRPERLRLLSIVHQPEAASLALAAASLAAAGRGRPPGPGAAGGMPQ
ncbi:hypothetical protein [Teichococcus oryzae]|uniref:Uncharacterized protein n=1 Tax=Teichococcus oryzae TaxID=1608942 RepID=A0A5B2TGE2_9PROT|nr:hypothetical protein [Pseudoroseomonas oryzae]KAA2212978.1 hypothetical protein F0Q34_12715 [Pseudoroseomonas oryzae]